MKECYECSQQNLKYKSDELDETRYIVDSLQEKLVAIENELMSYKNGETDHSKLFVNQFRLNYLFTHYILKIQISKNN